MKDYSIIGGANAINFKVDEDWLDGVKIKATGDPVEQIYNAAMSDPEKSGITTDDDTMNKSIEDVNLMRRKWITSILLAAIAVCLTGCPGGNSGSASRVTTVYSDSGMSTEMFDSAGIQAAGRSANAASEGNPQKKTDSDYESSSAKLIRTVHMELKSDTNNVESTAAAIAARAGEYGGYADRFSADG